MPLGGGQSGFGSGGTAGVGTSLNYIGDHAYSNSGELASNTSAVTHLSFNTESKYIVGRVTCFGATNISNIAVGRTSVFQVKFNSEIIATLKTDTAEEDMPTVVYTELLIPPYTRVDVTCLSDASSADRFTSAIVVGRVY